MKEIGKVYDAEEYGSQACPDCMRVTTNDTYLLWPEIENITTWVLKGDKLQTIRIALCPCGNVFVRQILKAL